MKRLSTVIFVAAAALLLAPPPAGAQIPDNNGATPSEGGFGGHGHHGKHADQADAPSSAPLPISHPKVIPDPRQRLDVGALLCGTEDELRQHQAAVAARLEGHRAAEPAGCRIIQQMVAVNVMQRDGPARAHVLLQGKEVEEGWTDAVIPDLPTGLQ